MLGRRRNSALEVLMGGAAEPGKTSCLIAMATRHIGKVFSGVLQPRLSELLLALTHRHQIGGQRHSGLIGFLCNLVGQVGFRTTANNDRLTLSC